jgi:hypothetical protein
MPSTSEVEVPRAALSVNEACASLSIVPLRRRPPVRLICEARDWGSAVDAMIVSTERKWT